MDGSVSVIAGGEFDQHLLGASASLLRRTAVTNHTDTAKYVYGLTPSHLNLADDSGRGTE